MSTDVRSVNILVAALGGEGGGVLADWIVTSAIFADYPVQSTSIPGVAQRTGATTYYLELFPRRRADLKGAQPVLALTATPGDIDLVVASELVEAGRAIQNGFVTPDRTTLVASTNRVFAIGERTAMADGRFDSELILTTARHLARRAILFDMSEYARKAGCPVNAVMFGALIGTQCLPIDRAQAEQAIRESGKSVDSNLRGFALGFDQIGKDADRMEGTTRSTRPVSMSDAVLNRMRSEFPPTLHETLAHGINRLIDYQDAAYAELYLNRLKPIVALDRQTNTVLSQETARFLALWMSYEDVIRVADLKTRKDRVPRIRKEVRAGEHEVVRVTEFLKPGLEELCSLFPARLGQRLYDYGRKHNLDRQLNVGMYIRTTSVSGFFLLRLLSGLRWWRRRTWRFHEEQALIGQWLKAIERAAGRDPALALEVALCGQIVKGYGDTHARAVRSFGLIRDRYFAENILTTAEPTFLAVAIRDARKVALADPEGAALTKQIERFSGARAPSKFLTEDITT